jgi:hypothetical protein
MENQTKDEEGKSKLLIPLTLYDDRTRCGVERIVRSGTQPVGPEIIEKIMQQTTTQLATEGKRVSMVPKRLSVFVLCFDKPFHAHQLLPRHGQHRYRLVSSKVSGCNTTI